MLLLARANQADVLAALTSGLGPGFVGPTSSAGWTAAWVDDNAEYPKPELGDHVCLVEVETGLAIQVVTAGERISSTWTEHFPQDGTLEIVASRLSDLFDAPERTAEVLRALQHPFCVEDEVVDELVRVLDLPETWEPAPTRGIVVHRGDSRSVRMAGRIAGPTRLSTLGQGWSVLAPVDSGHDYPVLAGAAGAAGAKQSNRVLALWRGEGAASGFEAYRGQHIAASWTWNTGWKAAKAQVTIEADEAADLLARQFGLSQVDLISLRALLRAADRAADPLAELADLLALPPLVLPILDGSPDVPGDELLPALSATRAVWEAMRLDDTPPRSPRWLRWVWAIATGIATFVCVGMVALGISLIVTDGAAIDQDGSTAEDWVMTLVFAVLAIVLAPTTRWRLRRARLWGPDPGSWTR